MEQNMYFGSLQNAVGYLFNGYPVRTLMINNNPWFVARDIANILGYPNAGNMIRPLYRHQVSVINIKDIVFNVYDANNGQINSGRLASSISQSPTQTFQDNSNVFQANDEERSSWHNTPRTSQGLGGGNPNMTIISLGGVYALCNITSKMNPIIETFVKYIDEVILNTLWQRPDLVQEIENYHRELDNSRSMANMYHDESTDLRIRYNKANDQINMLLAYIDAIGIPDPNPDKFRESYNAFKNHGNIEMCRKINRFSK